MAAAAILPASAADMASLTLDPPSGSIAGEPGQTAGWGFTLLWTSTTNWISVTSSALTFETNPSLGTYTDFIGLQGGPLPSFALGPSTSWQETFDNASQQGVGSFQLAGNAIPFSLDSGSIIVFFDIFDGDPLVGGSQTGSSSVTVPFSVIVNQPSGIPEPSTAVLISLSLLAIVAMRRLRRIPRPVASTRERRVSNRPRDPVWPQV